MPRRPSIGDAAAFYRAERGRLGALLRAHRDEFAADGWRRRGDADDVPAKAVVRAGLLLDVGPVAAQLRYLLGHGGLPFTYTMNAARLKQWTSLHAKANRIVADVHGEDSPDNLWRELQRTERTSSRPSSRVCFGRCRVSAIEHRPTADFEGSRIPDELDNRARAPARGGSLPRTRARRAG